MAIVLTDENFDEYVINSDLPVLVDFGAEWCGPCKVIDATIEQLSLPFEGRVVVGKIDVDNNPVITSKYGVRNMPTLLFFKDGNVVDKQVGAVPKVRLESKLDAIL